MAMVFGASQCLSYNQVINEVMKKKINQREARDSVRCMLTQVISQMKVVTIDTIGNSFRNRSNRHVISDLNYLSKKIKI